MRALICFLVTLMFLAPAMVMSMVKSELTIYTEHFPPYNFKQNNQIVGVNIDIVKLACQRINVDCRIKLYPWKRAMILAQNSSSSGLVSTARTPERESLFQWVGPLVSNENCFFKLKKRTDIQVQSRNDLLNNTIGLPWSDVYEEILKDWGFVKDVNYITYYRKYGYGKAFQSGKLDLFIASPNTLSQHLEHLSLTIDDIEPVFVFETPKLGGNYLALNKQAPKWLTQKLQQEVTAITDSEQLSKLKKRYITPAKERHEKMSQLEKTCF